MQKYEHKKVQTFEARGAGRGACTRCGPSWGAGRAGWQERRAEECAPYQRQYATRAPILADRQASKRSPINFEEVRVSPGKSNQ
jgi:hypothetical protein